MKDRRNKTMAFYYFLLDDKLLYIPKPPAPGGQWGEAAWL